MRKEIFGSMMPVLWAILAFALAFLVAVPLAKGEDISLSTPIMVEGQVLDSLGRTWLTPDSVIISIYKNTFDNLVWRQKYITSDEECALREENFEADTVMTWQARWLDIDSTFSAHKYLLDDWADYSLWEFTSYIFKARFHADHEDVDLDHVITRHFDLGAQWAQEQARFDYDRDQWVNQQPFVHNDGEQLSDCDNPAVWNLLSGDASIYGDAVNKKEGDSSLQIVIDVGTVDKADSAVIEINCREAGMNTVWQGGNITFWVYQDSTRIKDGHGNRHIQGTQMQYGIDSIVVAITKDTDSSYTNAVAMHFSGEEMIIGWSPLVFCQDTNKFIGLREYGDFYDWFTLNADTVRYMKFTIFADTSSYYDSLYINIDDIQLGVNNRPTIIMLFSDAPKTHRYIAWPIMKSFHLRGIFFVPPSRCYNVGADSIYMSWDELRPLYADGNDISNHGYGHAPLWTALMNNGMTNMKTQVNRGYRELVNHGFHRSAGYFQFPAHERNDTCVAAVKEFHVMAGFSGQQSLRWGHIDTYNDPDATELYTLPDHTVTSTSPDSAIHLCRAQGNLQVWGWHAFDTEVQRRKLYAACSTLSANRWSIDALTVSEYRNRYLNIVPIADRLEDSVHAIVDEYAGDFSVTEADDIVQVVTVDLYNQLANDSLEILHERLADLIYFFGACDDCYYRLFPEGGEANKDSLIVIDPSLGADSLVGKIQYLHGTEEAVYDTALFLRAPWW